MAEEVSAISISEYVSCHAFSHLYSILYINLACNNILCDLLTSDTL